MYGTITRLMDYLNTDWPKRDLEMLSAFFPPTNSSFRLGDLCPQRSGMVDKVPCVQLDNGPHVDHMATFHYCFGKLQRQNSRR